jgi:hypothetical protein
MGPRQSNRRTSWIQAVWLVCIIGVVIYALYASYARTGLAGYAMKLQMDLWGSASEGTTVMMTMGALGIAFIVIAGLAERAFPSLRGSRVNAVQQANRPLGPLSWKWLSIICLAPVLVGGVVSAFWYRSEGEDAKAKVYSVDLRSSPAALPKGARLVEVTGVIARPLVLGYKKTHDQTVTHELFAPLTAGNDHEPVRYVVHNEASETYDGQVNWPDVFRHRGAVVFSGRIAPSLPSFVVSGLRAKGAVLDPSYAVIEWRDLRNRQFGGSVSDEPWFMPLAIGGLISVFLLPSMLIVKFKLGRMNRRQQAAGLQA